MSIRNIAGKCARRAGNALNAARGRPQDPYNTVTQHGFGQYGPGCKVRPSAAFTGAERIELGANVHIGSGAWVRGEGGLRIGDHTHISRNVAIYTLNHRYEGERLPYDEQMEHKPVRIGRNVWIGMNVCICPGTVIGDGAIVGLGTVVFGEVPAMAIIGSAAWRVLGTRDPERYQALEAQGAYGGVNGLPYAPDGSETP